MIRIHRGNCPLSLQKTGSEFVEGDYKKNDVLLALVEMQHGKCCYCERYLLELPPNEREVEHYIPRSYFKDDSGRIQWHLVITHPVNGWLDGCEPSQRRPATCS